MSSRREPDDHRGDSRETKASFVGRSFVTVYDEVAAGDAEAAPPLSTTPVTETATAADTSAAIARRELSCMTTPVVGDMPHESSKPQVDLSRLELVHPIALPVQDARVDPRKSLAKNGFRSIAYGF
jgi:hypothetical protein